MITNIETFDVEGPKLLTYKSFKDERGCFFEGFNRDNFWKLDIGDLIQDNFAESKPGVIRGLHFQTSPWQGKLVQVIYGVIKDVFVDIRLNSSTFGKATMIQLEDQTKPGGTRKALWVPPGFAHGYCVSDVSAYERTIVCYKVDARYNPESEGGIIWNDDDLNIKWEIQYPNMADKDKQLPTFQEAMRKLYGEYIFNDQ